MLQTRKYKNKKYNCFVKNNRSKWTILFIHGFASSYKFSENLFKLKNNYNIVSINMLDQKKSDFNIHDFWSVAKHFIKIIKTKKLIILGHSLGGAVIGEVGMSQKVKKVIWLSTIHPKMIEVFVISSMIDYLNNISNTKAKLANQIHKLSEKRIAKGQTSRINKFLKKDSKWNYILKETLANKKFMLNLDKQYKKLKPKSIFIVGKGDWLIKTKLFQQYVESFGADAKIIGKEHNPIKTNPLEINKLLNNLTIGKKRFFKWSIMKKTR